MWFLDTQLIIILTLNCTMHFMAWKEANTWQYFIGEFEIGSNQFLLGGGLNWKFVHLILLFISGRKKHGTTRPVPKHILSIYGYYCNIYFDDTSYPIEDKSMTIYMEFCKFMLNQSVSQLGKKQLNSLEGKISQIIITTNIANENFNI